MSKNHHNLIRKSGAEHVFEIINVIFMIILCIIMIYPLLYVVFASFSNPDRFVAHTGILLAPTGFTLQAYHNVLSNPYILSGYLNTAFIVLVGVIVNLFMTSLGAYALSRPQLAFRRPIMLAIMFTMYFSGGMIPSYFNVQDLGLMDSLWALILPGAINTMNLVIMRTAFEAIPASLEESARIDGANEWVILWRIMLPLTKATLAVMVLYYGVGHWNSWFNASLYIKERSRYPLQLILREILVRDQASDMMSISESSGEFINLRETIKYATVIVATVPVLCIYPFIQKYFTKGVMIGAVKE
jgi:putative aldouronate transport system permease protein